MLDRNKLKAAIVERGLTQEKVAKMLGITPKTFYEKMKRGNFGTAEAKVLIDKLDIRDPIQIFFADDVT